MRAAQAQWEASCGLSANGEPERENGQRNQNVSWEAPGRAEAGGGAAPMQDNTRTIVLVCQGKRYTKIYAEWQKQC